jgi:hypothetical protein
MTFIISHLEVWKHILLWQLAPGEALRTRGGSKLEAQGNRSLFTFLLFVSVSSIQQSFLIPTATVPSPSRRLIQFAGFPTLAEPVSLCSLETPAPGSQYLHLRGLGPCLKDAPSYICFFLDPLMSSGHFSCYLIGNNLLVNNSLYLKSSQLK